VISIGLHQHTVSEPLCCYHSLRIFIARLGWLATLSIESNIKAVFIRRHLSAVASFFGRILNMKFEFSEKVFCPLSSGCFKINHMKTQRKHDISNEYLFLDFLATPMVN